MAIWAAIRRDLVFIIVVVVVKYGNYYYFNNRLSMWLKYFQELNFQAQVKV